MTFCMYCEKTCTCAQKRADDKAAAERRRKYLDSLAYNSSLVTYVSRMDRIN